MIDFLIFFLIKRKVKTGDREGGIRLAQRWRRLVSRSPSACYFEYWARMKDRDDEPGEHIDLLRRARELAPYRMNTGVNVLVAKLIQMYAKDGREEDAAEVERILDETNEAFGDSPWELGCRADLAFLRGEIEYSQSLRKRALDLQPNMDHPHVLLERALQRVDEGDREGAVPLLAEAAASRNADALVHVYLTVLVEDSDEGTAATHRAAAQRMWSGSPQGLAKEFDFCRERINEGPFANLRSKR